MMRSGITAILGVSDHAGWAVGVTVGPGGELLDRRRVQLVDETLPKLPHHVEAQSLPLEAARALIEQVRISAEAYAQRALDAVEADVPFRIGAVALRRCPPLPPTVAERISDYRARNVADTVMYRTAMAGAAESRGWRVHWYDAKKVLDGVRLPEKSEVGPPWGRDQRVAMAAAMAASRTQ